MEKNRVWMALLMMEKLIGVATVDGVPGREG